jgi:hypothetical protein
MKKACNEDETDKNNGPGKRDEKTGTKCLWDKGFVAILARVYVIDIYMEGTV